MKTITVCVPILLCAGLASATPSDCVGDCGSDGSVTVDEVVQGVSIALGAVAISGCPAFDGNTDGQVTVDEVITAVTNALGGCRGAIDTPVPQPTPTVTPRGLLFDGVITELVPHGVGDELIYRVTFPDGRVTMETDRVISSDANGFKVETFKFTTPSEIEVFIDEGTRLSQIGGTDLEDEVRITCREAVLQLALPIIQDRIEGGLGNCEARSTRTNRFLGQFEQRTNVRPIEIVEEVTLPAGVYRSVIHLRAETTIGSQTEVEAIFLAPGIGIIRNELSNFGFVTKTRELLDGTVGGQSVKRP